MNIRFASLIAGLAVAAPSHALSEDFEPRILSAAVELGGEIVINVRDGDKTVPDGAVCGIDLPDPYAAHVETVSTDCSKLTLRQSNEPIRDEAGYAIPSAQVPYDLVVRTAKGDEVGRVTGSFLYNNQFSDLRLLIRDIRNPVSPGQSFDAVVLGAGQEIADSLLCRWNLYGPVSFEPTSDNQCKGRLTATEPGGADADMDVEIVNLTDMHAVGYATARMIVK